MATLAIVGAHFVVMVPALGPLAGILGVACVANATGLARIAGYGVPNAWAADGVLKVALGAAMVAAAG